MNTARELELLAYALVWRREGDDTAISTLTSAAGEDGVEALGIAQESMRTFDGGALHDAVFGRSASGALD